MHLEPPILVLPNAWDVASAKRLAAVPGCRALATTSAAVARSLGFEDGEQAPRDVMVVAAGRIAHAVESRDRRPRSRVRRPRRDGGRGVGRGLVGINFEDSPGDVLLPVDEQIAHIEAIRVRRAVARDQRACRRIPQRFGRSRRGGRARQCVPARRRGLRLSDPLPARRDRRPRAAHRRADQRAGREASPRARRPAGAGSRTDDLGRGLARSAYAEAARIAAVALSGG